MCRNYNTVTFQSQCRLSSHLFDANNPLLQKPLRHRLGAYRPDHPRYPALNEPYQTKTQKKKNKKQLRIPLEIMLLKKVSSRTYNLRARTGAGIATQSSPARDTSESPEPSVESIDYDRPASDLDRSEGRDPRTEVTTRRTYSDVVASRPPSPREEIPRQPLESAVENAGTHNVGRVPHQDDEGCVGGDADRMGVDYDSHVNPGSPEREEVPWTTVNRRSARSRSANRTVLTAEQSQTVKMAAAGLTKEQQAALQRRQEKMRPRRASAASSRGEGPSRPKGKGPDPLDWGNVNISRESLDLEAQAAALNSFQPPNRDARRPEKEPARRDKKASRSNKGGARHHERERATTDKRPSKRHGRPDES